MTVKSVVKKIILGLVPIEVLRKLFPNRLAFRPFESRFIEIRDEISQRSFEMFMREDSWIERELLAKGLYGEWEKTSLRIWAELSKNADVILDIGANTGIYSLLAQVNNPRAQIIAVEPVDINFSILSQNVFRNIFPIHLAKLALSDTEGSAKMFMLEDKVNYMTSVNDDRYALHPEIKGKHKTIEIEVRKKPFSFIYDRFNLQDIDLVKLDVEGHEMVVLKGMHSYLKKHKPTILIEVIGDEHAAALNQLFQEIGYTTYISISERVGAEVVDKLWDNDHQNFIVCTESVLDYLGARGLVKNRKALQ